MRSEPLRVRRSTAFNALRHGRRFIGIEMDAAYLDGIARPRLSAELAAFEGVPEVDAKPDAETELWDVVGQIMAKGG